MKKILLSLVAIFATMSSFAALKTVVFDMSKPESMGITGTGANVFVGSQSLVMNDVSIAVVKDADSRLQQVRFNGGTLKYGSGVVLSIQTTVGNIRSIKFEGDVCGNEDITVEPGTWNNKTWTGEAKTVTFTQAGAANSVSSITVTYQVPNPVDPRELGEVESYEAVKAIKGDPQLGEDGNPKLDGYGNPVYNFSYEFAPEFANPVLTEGALTVEYGTEHVKAVSVAGATAKTCDATSVTEWNEMKFELKNHLNDNTSNLHKGIATGTGNPVFGYEIEPVWSNGVISGYRQCFKNVNPEYDGAAAYAAKEAGQTYDVPQYLNDGKDVYYWEPGCGEMPAQGLYHKFTADCDGQIKIFAWLNKTDRNTFLVDEETKEYVSFQAEGYINNVNETTETGAQVKKFLSVLDVEALQDPSHPYVVGSGKQPFWGNVIYDIKKDQCIWLFQSSSQVGIGGFEFRPYLDPDGIENVTAESVKAVRKAIVNGKLVIVKANNTYNVAGQLVK